MAFKRPKLKRIVLAAPRGFLRGRRSRYRNRGDDTPTPSAAHLCPQGNRP